MPVVISMYDKRESGSKRHAMYFGVGDIGAVTLQRMFERMSSV